MSRREFAMPDLGEGLTESELVSWEVAVGDTVELNQIVAEVETAKALVQVPSPYAGVVAQLFVQPGTTVRVGSPILAVEVMDDADDAAAPGQPSPAQAGAGESGATRTPVLVGYGPAVEGFAHPQRKARASARAGLADSTHAQEPAAVSDSAPPERVREATPAERPLSTPPVRKLAADLGVALESVRGTGERGMVTRDDVVAASTGAVTSAAPAEAGHRVDNGEKRTPIAGVRKHTAAAMVASAFTAPHVTVFLTVDVTPTVELLETLRTHRATEGHRIGLLTLVATALLIAVRRNPSVNSRWDEAAGEIVQFEHVNLGIAAATDRGLIVPNIKRAETLNLVQLADALAGLTAAARSGSTSPADLRGGTISISNVGVFGVDAGTPILNPGEAAILAIGAIRRQPWEYRGEIALRNVMTLSLSFDHRLIDGEQGSRFLADIGSILAEPGTALAMV